MHEPNYSKLAARLLSTFIDKEVQNQNVYSFSQSVELWPRTGHHRRRGVLEFVRTHARKLNDAIDPERNKLYEFFGPSHGVRPLSPTPSKASDTSSRHPQYFLMRVACGLSSSAEDAIKFYELRSCR